MKVLEIELRPCIVASEDLRVVQDDGVDLVRTIELSAFVLMHDQREVASAFVLDRARLGWRWPTGLGVVLTRRKSLKTLDAELA